MDHNQDKLKFYKKEEMLKVSKVAKRLGCTPQHVYNLINEGALPAFRFGKVKLLMVPSTGLDNYISQSIYDPGL